MRYAAAVEHLHLLVEHRKETPFQIKKQALFMGLFFYSDDIAVKS